MISCTQCFVLLCIVATAAGAGLNVLSQDNVPSAPLPSTGEAVDEVVVESSLYIKPKAVKQGARSTRSIADFSMVDSLREHVRVKRAPRRRGHDQQQQQQPQYGQSQAAANAAANQHYQDGEGGFGASAANAHGQAFNAFGAAGGFGASSAGTVTQSHNANRFGQLQSAAGASHSQGFVLPNGQTINFASTNSFANGGAGNAANSRSGAVSVGGGGGF